MSHAEILARFDRLRELVQEHGDELDRDQRRELLERMDQLAQRLSYDEDGYDQERNRPVVPPRHDRLTSDTGEGPDPAPER